MLQLHALFSDHMVLQRRQTVPVWGTAEPGDRICVTIGNFVEYAYAKIDGTWLLNLEPMEAGGPYEMRVFCAHGNICFTDVWIGEVWLAGGQSNMELELVQSKDGEKEVEGSNRPWIRFYQVPKYAVLDAEQAIAEKEMKWQVCSPATSRNMSAVAYHFACEIQETQKLAIGIIHCCWGGTSISCWMSREQLSRTMAGQGYIDRYAALVGDKTDEQYKQEMEEYFTKWNAWNDRVQAYKAENPDTTWEILNETCGLCPWPQPAGNQSPFRPAGLYESMIRRVAPYGMRGFLYYQGEEDQEHFATYEEMLYLLIDQWRRDWGREEMPVILAQLPMYCSKEEYVNGEDSKNWAYMRTAQMKASKTIANTGIAVLTDCGEFDNIHPLDKLTVGHRMALQARKYVYGEEIVADGPQCQYVKIEGHTMIVTFAFAQSGLIFTGDTLRGFEMAGENGIFFEASGRIQDNQVILSSMKVSQPCYVRYGWTNFGEANLYNQEGLAAASFTTL